MPERYLGRTLGKYRVEELVGSGGFAWVYRGYDPTLEIPVALKVLKPQYAGDPQFEERFRREASTAARLRHPNIVKIYEVGRDGDAVYFAMDYLPSGLANKLDAMPFLAEDFVIQVGIDVAKALGFAHREGVIHRDIKIDNILFDVHGNAVVADFGIARAVSGYTQQTGTNMVVGTPQYFAPEQARAKPLDGRADIYSLGVSLYRAATGRLPFEGDDWYEIARAHVEDQPQRPRDLNPAISVTFERVLLRCLAKHPDDRPATGEQLADELAAVLTAPRIVGESTGGSTLSRVFLSPRETPTVAGSPASRSPRRLRRAIRRTGAVALILAVTGAVALQLIALANTGAAAPSGPPPLLARTTVSLDSAVADSLRRITPVDPIDSVLAAQAARPNATRPRPIATTGGMRVSAPEGAQLTIDGRDVAGNSWSADSLRPGAYTVRASLESAEGCSAAHTSRTVQVRAGEIQQVNLDVKSCGTLQIVVRNNPLPADLRYQVSGEGVRFEGPLPLGSPLVLPVGNYTLRVTAGSDCQEYESRVQVGTSRGGTAPRIALICGLPAP